MQVRAERELGGKNGFIPEFGDAGSVFLKLIAISSVREMDDGIASYIRYSDA
jgi:hypothetical protein